MIVDKDTIKKRLLVKYPFFRSTIAKLKIVEDINCLGYNGNPTAGTDGDTVYYHPDFMNNLDEDEQLFIFAHEVGHVALNHIIRSEGRDQEIWNIAADAVLNANLIKDGLKFVKGGVNIPEAINYNAETFYNKLIQEKEQKKSQNQKGNGNQQSNSKADECKNSSQSDSSNQNIKQNSNDSNNIPDDANYDVGFDTHKMWNDAINKTFNSSDGTNELDNSKNDRNNKDKQSFLEKLFKKKKDKGRQLEQTEKENQESENQNNIFEMDEQEAFSKNREEKKKLLRELRDSFAKQSIGAGNTTDQSIRKIDNIGTSISLIDWRKLLKECVKFDIDWTYKNATIENGVVTPYLEETPTPETEIVLDTSGSIDDNLLRNFLMECKNILQTSKVKVGCFDTKFYGFQEIKTVKDIENMEFKGHGGTDFNVAVEAFSKRVENKIIFTDGQASMPEKSIDAIWIVFGGRKINPKGGKVIYISDEQFKRLCFKQNDDNLQGKNRTR